VPTLTNDMDTMSSAVPDTNDSVHDIGRSQQGRVSYLRWGLLVLALLAMMAAILVVRGWRPWSSDSARASTVMATSPDIENVYGIRFTAVGITAAGGMIMLRYQVLDSAKTTVVHDKDTAPYVLGPNGKKYADPGMQGHTHVGKVAAAGSTDFVLLANSGGGVHVGDRVTIRIGTFALENVMVV